jgi:hypothetical protein
MFKPGLAIFVPLFMLGGREFIIRARSPQRGVIALAFIVAIAISGMTNADPARLAQSGISLKTAVLTTGGIILLMLPAVVMLGALRRQRVTIFWQAAGAIAGGIAGGCFVIYGILALGCAGWLEGCEM